MVLKENRVIMTVPSSYASYINKGVASEKFFYDEIILSKTKKTFLYQIILTTTTSR